MPGIAINESDMNEQLLGFTDGSKIWRKRSLQGIVKEFVLFHEEEHVMDMGASEMEVDSRALARLKSKTLQEQEKDAIKALLSLRWPQNEFEI